MKLFTVDQRLVINKLWIPVLATIVMLLPFVISRISQMESVSYYDLSFAMDGKLWGIPMNMILLLPVYVLMYSLEFFVLKNKRAVPVTLLGALLLTGFLLFESRASIAEGNARIYAYAGVECIIWVSLLLLRTYALEKKSKTDLITAIIAGLLISIMPWGHSIVYIINNFLESKYLAGFECMFGYAVFPMVYYLLVFVAENISKNNFIQAVKSKITIMDKRTYLFAVIALYAMIVGAAITTTNVFAPRGYGVLLHYITHVPLLLQLLVAMGVLLLAPYMLKNIVMARLLTVGKSGKLWLVGHFIPVINVIVTLVLFNSREVHSNEEENALLYVEEPESDVRYYFLIFNVFILIWGCIMVFARGRVSEGKLFLSLLSFRLTLVSVFFRHKWPVYVLCAISVICCCSIAYGEFAAFWMMQIVLSFYYMMEVFHPALYGEDAVLYHKAKDVVEEDTILA
ncbi:hypothetical protein [Chitinophaga sp. Cy-1792]|uniref:hypothetical protein n=1 Tax=Chitinophaga sp. Cy-1792 TaxID=2608339 RepID=UPI00141F937A|nr:hypothetical protein [Chitinophaga sp. Cy-1792]NIG52735.1 hypothetical protein [Chitinophaga sp. Cy-1792]